MAASSELLSPEGQPIDALIVGAGDSIGIDELTVRIFGAPSLKAWGRRPSALDIGVIRPLVWCGPDP
jgi:hypothetical protein